MGKGRWEKEREEEGLLRARTPRLSDTPALNGSSGKVKHVRKASFEDIDEEERAEESSKEIDRDKDNPSPDKERRYHSVFLHQP